MPENPAPAREQPGGIQSVTRTLMIFGAFEDAESLTLRDLTARTGLPKPTVFRIAATLVGHDYLARDASGGYCLGPAFIGAARRVLTRGLNVTARPYLEQLNAKSGHSVNLGVLHNGEILYIDSIDAGYGLRMVSSVGTREPIHATAIGKAIASLLPDEEIEKILEGQTLARLTPRTITSRLDFRHELEEVRTRGYALDDGECVVGARCVAAPIRDLRGVVGGISVSGSAEVLDDGEVAHVASLVVETADAVTEALGGVAEVVIPVT